MQVLTQPAVQRLIQIGIKKLKEDPDILDDVFCMYTLPQMNSDYGQKYIDNIKTWFVNTKIPVVQAWSFNAERIPCISVHLSNEGEDEQKASIGDFFGDGEDGECGTAVFSVNLDIGCHTSRNGDEVLWLYYITSYILFKNKRLAEYMGLKLQTFSAGDYEKDNTKMADNIWTRWIKFRCTTENFWDGDPFITIEDLQVGVDAESVPQDLGPVNIS